MIISNTHYKGRCLYVSRSSSPGATISHISLRQPLRVSFYFQKLWDFQIGAHYMLYSTVYYNTTQHNTTQHKTIQYNVGVATRFFKLFFFFENFYGAHYIFSCHLSRKSNMYLPLVLRPSTPSAGTCLQLDFSATDNSQFFNWKTLSVSGQRYATILLFLFQVQVST